MSKFCMYCGRELQDGEVCNCREKAIARGQAASQNSESSSQASSAGGPTFYTAPPTPPKKSSFVLFLEHIWYYLKHFFKAPTDTIAKAANQKDYAPGIFFAVVSSLLCSLLGIALLNRCVSAVNAFTDSAFGTKYFTLNSFLQPFGLTTDRAFFAALIGMIVCYFLFCALALAAARIAKSGVSFAGVLAAVGVSYIGTACGTIVAVILGMLIPALSLPLLAGAIILSFTFVYIALVKSFKLSANKMAYLFAIIVTVMALIFVIVCRLTPITIDFSGLMSGNTMTPSVSSGSGLESFFGSGY